MLRADVAGAMKSAGQAAKGAGQAMKNPGEAMKNTGRPQDRVLNRGARRDPELYVREMGRNTAAGRVLTVK